MSIKLTITICFAIASALSAHSLCAQSRSKKAQSATAKAVNDSVETARQTELLDIVIAQYQFDEAEALLQKEIKKAKQRRQPAMQQEELLSRVQKAKNMMRSTQEVTFIDSFVVSQSDIIATIKLGRELGSIVPVSNFLSKIQASKYAKDVEGTAFINEFGDKAYFPMRDESTERNTMYYSKRIADNWSSPTPLQGLDSEETDYNYPYMSADGVTLYFAAQGSEGLGGYDIYVTRYNSNSSGYLLPENIGMPFNSMSNDYLYIIDEANNLGWFATDRRQPPGLVCIYVFIPNEKRTLVSESNNSEDAIREAALIHSISATHTDPKAVDEAKRRLAAVSQQSANSHQESSEGSFTFIVDDYHVYHKLSDFTSAQAIELVKQWHALAQKINKQEKAIESMRSNYTDSQKLISAEEQLITLYEQLRTTEKTIRRAELKQ